ncbi:MAG: 6-carboxytetrahydropterin synthase [Methanomassiliicoccales archaeon]|nr:6-carboxytetrahydropterin synthase [Methanomassiliicoccales archaeon]
MFSVTLSRPMASKHFFPDLEGAEGVAHSHQYKIEVTVMGEHLDHCGFLVNVDLIAALLEKTQRRFEGKLLNRMIEFRDTPPSMENLAMVIWSKITEGMDHTCVERVKVTIWEANDVCASFEQ